MVSYDRWPASAKFKEPIVYAGRWTGNSTANCNAVTNTGRDLTLIRSGVGVHTLAFASGAIVPVVEGSNISLQSPNTNGHQLQVTPYVSGTGWVITATHANGVAVDLASTEEVQAIIWVAYTAVP